MSYRDLGELLKEHTDDEVFRAAMKWLSIDYQAKYRRVYKDEHGTYPTMEQGRENAKQSRYYLPLKHKD